MFSNSPDLSNGPPSRNEQNSFSSWMKFFLKAIGITLLLLLILSPIALAIFRPRDRLRFRGETDGIDPFDENAADNNDEQVTEERLTARVPHGAMNLDIPPGAVVHYTFDEGPTDVSGNNKHALLNGPVPCPGVYNSSAYRFDGNDYMIAPSLDRTGVMNLTLSAWVKLDSTGSYRHYLLDMRGDGIFATAGCGLTLIELVAGGHRIDHFCSWSSTSSSEFRVMVGDLRDQWHHTALVRQGPNMRAYLDGCLISDSPSSGISPLSNTLTWQNTWRIGVRFSGAYDLIGDLDEVLIYDRALPDEEIQRLAADTTRGLVAHYPCDGNPYDVSGNKHNATVFGAELVPDMSGRPDTAYRFNISDYIEVPNRNGAFDLTSGWSVLSWVNLAPANITTYRVISREDTFGLSCDFYNGVFECGTGLRRASDGLEFTTTSNHTISPIPPYIWHQIAGTYDGDDLSFYLNGTLASSRNIGPVVAYTGPAPLIFGGNYTLEGMSGSIDNARLYNRPLTPVEICMLFDEAVSRAHVPTSSAPSTPTTPTTPAVTTAPSTQDPRTSSPAGRGNNTGMYIGIGAAAAGAGLFAGGAYAARRCWIGAHRDKKYDPEKTSTEMSASNGNGRPPKPQPNLRATFKDIDFMDPNTQQKVILGAGGYGKVKRGHWIAGNIDVAVKTLSAAMRQQTAEVGAFSLEIGLMTDLRHPHIVAVYGGGLAPKPHLIMEFMSGGTLTRQLGPNLPWPMRLNYATQFAGGLAFLHSKDIIHRDLKPDNLLLDETGTTIKITDFGLAKLDASKSTMTKGVIGTERWTAPEVLRTGQYNMTADVYSFGIILWQIVAGEPLPFPQYTVSHTLSQAVIGGARPQIPDYCPQELQELIRACWHQNPAKRPTMKYVYDYLNSHMQLQQYAAQQAQVTYDGYGADPYQGLSYT